MANDLAALQVRLDLQTAAFEKGMKQATTSMGRLERRSKQTNTHMATIQKTMSRMGKTVIGLGAGLASAFTVRQVKNAIEYGDAIAKTADAIGLSTGTLQEYRFAAERSGVGTALLESSMTAFVKRVGELKGGIGPLVTGLKNIDQELMNNLKNSKSQEEALGILANRIQQSSSSTERAALANAAFGRSGIKMVNVLRDGEEGLKRFGEEARAAGVVLEDSLTRKAEVLNDKWDTFTETIKVKLSSAFLTAASAIGEVFGVYTDLATVQDKLIEKQNELLEAEISSDRSRSSAADARVKRIQEEIAALEKEEAQFIRVANARDKLNQPTSGSGGGGIGDTTKLTEYEKAMKSFVNSVKSSQREIDMFEDKIAELDALFFDGAISLAVYEQNMERLTGSMKDVETSATTLGTEMKVALGNTLSDGVSRLVDNIMDADASFKEFAKNFIKDVTAMITKMLILNSLQGAFGIGGGTAQAKGGAWKDGIQFFANGGIVNSPTAFGMAGGGTGIMGEQGAEAILPLSRGMDGDLGVKATMNVNVHNHTNAEVSVQQTDENTVDIMVNKVASDIMKGGTLVSRAIENAYGVDRSRGNV